MKFLLAVLLYLNAKTRITNGQIISGAIILGFSPKKQTNLLKDFCTSLYNGSNQKNKHTLLYELGRRNEAKKKLLLKLSDL